jgi:hypothetical protein
VSPVKLSEVIPPALTLEVNFKHFNRNTKLELLLSGQHCHCGSDSCSKSLNQSSSIIIVRESVFRVVVEAEKIQQKSDHLRRADSVGIPQASHGKRYGLEFLD